MTPDQVKEVALSAATLEFNRRSTRDHKGLRNRMRAAIDAYETAMWRPVAEANPDTSYLVRSASGGCAVAELLDGSWGVEVSGLPEYKPVWHILHFTPTHFRPLPQPPEVK